jgi:hypothetical protein
VYGVRQLTTGVPLGGPEARRAAVERTWSSIKIVAGGACLRE